VGPWALFPSLLCHYFHLCVDFGLWSVWMECGVWSVTVDCVDCGVCDSFECGLWSVDYYRYWSGSISITVSPVVQEAVRTEE
jgi:hypothetical protein